MSTPETENLDQFERRVDKDIEQRPFEEWVAEEFDVIADFLAEQYDFPELLSSELVFVHGDDLPSSTAKTEKDVVPFYVKQYDSRNLKFEFDRKKHDKFRSEFKSMYSDSGVENLGLDRFATMLYLGCGMVRPISEYEFFRKHAPLKAQHSNAVMKVYTSRNDLNNFFEDTFGLDASGPMHAQLVNEIPDREIMPINAARIALSFLYGGLRRDKDKVGMGELMHASREYLYNSIVNSRMVFQDIAISAHGDEGAKMGDWLFLDTIPSWVLAFACPIKPESYGMLSGKIWQDRFSIRGALDMRIIAEDLGNMAIDQPVVDIPLAWNPSGK